MSDLVFVIIIGDEYAEGSTIHSIHKDEDNAKKVAKELESSLRRTENVIIESYNLE